MVSNRMRAEKPETFRKRICPECAMSLELLGFLLAPKEAQQAVAFVKDAAKLSL